MSSVGCLKVRYWDLLFLIYMNYLHVAIKCSEIHHFADDTNLLNLNNCVKSIYKPVNRDLKSLVNWLKANKISLYVGKTELVLFISPKKQFDSNLKIEVRRKGSMKHIRSNIWQFELTEAWHRSNILIMWQLS